MARTRRGRGEGSIYQRGDGYWCANISVGFSDSGKRRRKTVYGATKAEVQTKLRTVANEVSAGGPVETSRLTLGEYLDRWLKIIAQSIAPNTLARYKGIVKNQLKPYLGGVRLVKLEPIHVEQLYVTLDGQKCSARSIQLSGVTLGKALQHAIKLKLITFNPVRGIAKPRVVKKEMVVWDAARVATFLKASKDDRLYPMYVIALAGGLRQGELFALKWSDVDFDGSCMTVQRSLEEINGVVRLKETKNGKARRVDLPVFAMSALRSHRAAMLAEGNIGSAVFCAQEGGYLLKANFLRRSFVPLIVAAEVPRIRFHDLRHTHATMLLQAGENIKVVSERLGHASVKITLDTYAHVLPTMQKAAADKMQKLLG